MKSDAKRSHNNFIGDRGRLMQSHAASLKESFAIIEISSSCAHKLFCAVVKT